MPHPLIMAEWRRARAAKAGAARVFAGYCPKCGVMVTSGVLVCEHGVTPSRAELIRQEIDALDRAVGGASE